MDSAAASVESVRLEPELREALALRAEHDHETTSSVIRKATPRMRRNYSMSDYREAWLDVFLDGIAGR